jgi:NAD-dependent dihydropyrimidine dehydrogenase PreA subunit/flavodoxin
MSTEIYYYSGTGNSLYTAKILQNVIPDSKLIPMISLLNKDIVQTNSENIGFVFPIYLTTIPKPVRNFLKKIDLGSAGYIFTVVTREGSLCLADVLLKKMLKKKGKKLDSFFILEMAGNSPTGVKPGPGDKEWVNKIASENILKLDSEVREKIELIRNVIKNKGKYPENDSSPFFKNFMGNLFGFLTGVTQTQIKFYNDETCTGCGICEKVCLSGRVKMNNKKPEWQKSVNCYYCFACFNFCPEQSVLLKNYTDKKGRYIHPEISVKDIAVQKL